MFGFLCAILLGTVLLSLPIASKNRTMLPLEDALFMATTSICVTGLTTVSVAGYFSVFGQAVILLLIQFGGLGVVTFTTLIMFLLGRRITLRERMLIQDAYNLDTLQGLVRMTKRIIKGTLIVEAFGAVIYAFILIPDADSFLQGLWQSVFHSVSAFCNAGMELLGTSSMTAYRDNVIMNLNTEMLIILGGIGFPVWWNLIQLITLRKRADYTSSKLKRTLTLQTRVVLITTAFLLAAGTVLTLILEWENPATIGNLNPFLKLQAAFFQSVTTRTAGFCTIPQENFTSASCVVYLVLMFIGGSPSGTAGGVKTATIALLVISTICIVKGKNDIEIFGRRIEERHLRKALTVIVVSFGMLIVMAMLLAAVQKSDFLDTLYEVTSALATVGLSRNFTGKLNLLGKLIITLCMYAGRTGPISMALSFNISRVEHTGTLPEGKITVG